MTPRRIALTGGIACGKSLLCRFLERLGWEVLDADEVAHSLISPEERARLAATVFRDAAARRALEARLHPEILRRILAWFDTPPVPHADGRPCAGKIAAIPLLFEVHWEKYFDTIVCVVASREKQIERLTALRGHTREEAEERLSAQMDAGEKASRSCYAIRNDGSAEQLEAEAAKCALWLARRAASGEGAA